MPGGAAAQRLKGRVALVTGASRGIGRAVAVALAREGAHLIIVGRALGSLEDTDDAIQAAGGSATILKLDLKQGERVDQLGPTLLERFGKLDILIGNAGMLGNLTPIAHVTDDAWAAVVGVNFAANWRLIRTLDPLLRRSDAGRAVFVTSGAAQKSTPYWGLYGASKAALEVLVKTYAAENATTPVKANLINPGPVRTGMRAKAYPGEDPMTLPTPDDLAPLFVELSLPSCARTGEVVNFRSWRLATAGQGA